MNTDRMPTVIDFAEGVDPKARRGLPLPCGMGRAAADRARAGSLLPQLLAAGLSSAGLGRLLKGGGGESLCDGEAGCRQHASRQCRVHRVHAAIAPEPDRLNQPIEKTEFAAPSPTGRNPVSLARLARLVSQGVA